MEALSRKKIKAGKIQFQAPKKERFKVDQAIVEVAMGQVLDIEIECNNGFSVFVPFPGIFNQVAGSDQVFNATPVPKSKDTWQVSIERLNRANPHPEKDFAYGIYIKEDDDFAVAASPPRMNINP